MGETSGGKQVERVWQMGSENAYQPSDLKQMQSLPMEAKIVMTQQRKHEADPGYQKIIGAVNNV